MPWGKGNEEVRRRRPTVVLEWHGEEVTEKAFEKLFWASIEQAKLILGTARTMTPRKTGTLYRSSTITVDKRPSMEEVFQAAGGGKSYTGQDFFDYFIPTKTPKPGKHNIYITYNTPYAVYQHENTAYKHPLGGEAKFLQKALEKHAATIQAAVGRAIKSAVRRRI